MPAFSLVWPPRLVYTAASLATRRSPTTPYAWTGTSPAGLLYEIYNFGGVLEPRYIVGAEPLDQ
jgi:hypothetical protein